MPIDDDLPPTRLALDRSANQITEHFAEACGVRVDAVSLAALPAEERLRLAGARQPEPPEARLLDRVLQLVPPVLLGPIERVVILQSRGTARMGGHRNGIVRVSAQEARLREGDARYGDGFSLFTTTVLHEIGHAVWDLHLTAAQRTQLGDDYLDSLIDEGEDEVAPDEPSESEAEHFFVDLFVAALLGHGPPGIGAGVARRRLAALGLEIWQR
jgi:hypothetical protein